MEVQIIGVIGAVNELAAERTWAIDILGTPSALLVALLATAGEPTLYAPGRVVVLMSSGYTCEEQDRREGRPPHFQEAGIRADLTGIDSDTDLVRTPGRAVRMINRRCRTCGPGAAETRS